MPTKLTMHNVPVWKVLKDAWKKYWWHFYSSNIISPECHIMDIIKKLVMIIITTKQMLSPLPPRLHQSPSAACWLIYSLIGFLGFFE